MGQRTQMSSTASRAIVFAAAALILGALTWPLLFSSSGFAGDWKNHLWLMWQQARYLKADGAPSLFLNSSHLAFNPIYAFYSGTLYAVGGLLSLALGEAPLQAYVTIYILDFTAALGGWYWLGRMARLGRWAALVPGVVFVTSTYYVVLVYVRGDWPEFTGVSMIPLMVAASLSLLRAEGPRLRAALALAASSIVFFGAHSITILLGVTTIALTGTLALILVGEARQLVTVRGIARVSGVLVPAVLVNAWYLLPALAYESRTFIGSDYHLAQKHEVLRFSTRWVSFRHLFTFSRTSAIVGGPSPFPLSLSLPVLAIVWILVGIVILPWGGRSRAWRRTLLICAALATLVTLAMTHAGLLLALPNVYSTIQFSYRLESYVLLECSAAILAALVLARGGPRRIRAWAWMAIPVCAVSLIGAIQQIRAYPPGESRYRALKPGAELEGATDNSYQDVSAPVINGRGLVTLGIPKQSIHDDRVSGPVRLRAGTLVATNIVAGSYLLHVTGARPVGTDSLTGAMVLRVGSAADRASNDRATASQPAITVSTGNGLPIVLGRLLSLAGIGVLAIGLVLIAAARLAGGQMPIHRLAVGRRRPRPKT
jgi:hypothetical protein